MSGFARKIRRHARPFVPGVHLMHVFHEAYCKAPVLDCTCTPIMRVRENIQPLQFIESVEAEQARCAAIKAALD